jgi:hypothetical protein
MNYINKLFNRVNLINIFIIFIVGFIYRFLISYFLDINLFIDYTSLISIIYYFFISCFIVFVYELVDHFSSELGFNKIISGVSLGDFDSNIKFVRPSDNQMIDTNKDIKVILNLNANSVNNKSTGLNFSSNRGVNTSSSLTHYNQGILRGSTLSSSSIEFKLDSNNGDDISMLPIVNKNKKPAFFTSF